MEYGYGTEGYYQKMLELQERLRKSEEERLKLEEKFNEMMQLTRDAEHDRLRLMRHRYHKFLEEDKIRQDRNENILRALDRIESRAKMLAAKTSRFKAFRKQYESYIKRIYRAKTEQQPSFQNTSPSQPDRNFTHSNVRKKLFSDLPSRDESVEDKLAMLEQYLRDNFDNFPRDRPTKSQNNDFNDNRIFEEENGHDPNIFENQQRNRFFNQNHDRQQYFDIPDSDSKESQEVVDDYNNYFTRQYNGKVLPEQHFQNSKETQNVSPPTKSELLGSTIEKELERLKNKEPIKQNSLQKENSFEMKQPEQVIQDYKDLVTKSEEKYGLRGESPVRRNVQENKELSQDLPKIPNIFDNTTKTLNIEELKNIASKNIDKTTEEPLINSNKVLQENADSESDSSVIKNYKNMIKSLHEELPPTQNNNVNDEVKPQGPNIIQENSISENSKQEDNSERTEPPSDVSLNFSSHKSEEPLPMEQPKTELNILKEEHLEDNSVDELTIKEQLHINPEKEQNKLSEELERAPSTTNNQTINNPPNIDNQNYQSQEVLGEQVYQETNQDIQPVYEEQNVTDQQPEYQEGYDLSQQHITDPAYQAGYELSQQNVADPVYQEGYDNQQPEYQEGYDISQQNIPNQQLEYQEGYDVSQHDINNQQPEYQQGYDTSQQNIPNQQPEYQEDYDTSQQNIPNQQPDYQEGYDMSQQNINNQQPEYQEGYDISQQNVTDPNYQEGYDPQYYAQQQNEPGQEGYDNQQYAEGQPMYPEGYEQQQEGYDPQQYPTDQAQYQEYPEQEYQPQEYSQEYTDQQYPQEGQVSENVYRSQQEYLEGEQNIDKQYETEQNQEYQQQEYQDSQDHLVQEQPQEQSEFKKDEQQENNVIESESTEKTSSLNEFVDNKPLVEKKLPNLAEMLDTDTESIKQDTKVSNDSDFDFSKS